MNAIILAGGLALRMGGTTKAFLRLDGERFIDRILRVLGPLFEAFIVVTNEPELFAGLGVRVVRDEREGVGPLMGLYSGLKASVSTTSFITAADTPLVNEALVRRLLGIGEECDVLVPRWNGNVEPLCAVYARRCLPAIERVLDRGRIVSFFPLVRVCYLEEPAVRMLDPRGLSFFNVNSPADYDSLRSLGD